MRAKIVAVVLLLCLLSVYPPAFAEYPASGGVVDFHGVFDVAQTESWVPSDSKNIFTVDGKRFILLDTDVEGNYFVLTEEHYGTYPFESNLPNTVPLSEAITADGKTTFIDKEADLSDTESWRFQPQRPTNVAYWLNHTFVSDGNTNEFRLPQQVYNNILERTWEVEGFQSSTDWTAAQNYDGYFGVSTAADYAAAFHGNSYSFSAKLSLLSFQEYIAYKDKIGVTFNNSGGWAGMLLRTCDSMVTCTVSGNKRTLNLVRAPLQVRTKNADSSDHGYLAIRTADAISSRHYYVRPCFWLSKDFFKNTACELSCDENGVLSIGEVPLEKIKAYSYEELKSIYTDGQLASIGYQVPKREMEVYPPHSFAVKDLGAGERGETGLPEYYASPAENLFAVDGKKFILLDRDSDGNYFVMANEEYGQHEFASGISSSDKQCTDKDWGFDPSNQNSVAYWLNHHFLEYGGKMKYSSESLILPQAIRDSMITAEWEIEPHYPINSWTVNSYANAAVKEEIAQWHSRQRAAAEKRVVRCKVALMSYTEYEKYKEKIGLSVLADGYGGFSFRTPRGQASATADGTWSVLIGQLQAANNDAVKQIVFTTCGVNNDTYYVRPVFWLSGDFFAAHALDLESMGSNVKAELASSYDYLDLKGLYTDSQLRSLGIQPTDDKTSSVPSADKLYIGGIPSVGGVVTGEYRYLSGDVKSRAAEERFSKYVWYISDTAEGEKTVCSNEISYVPKEEDAGKYLRFGVVPRNLYGVSTDREYLSRPVLIGNRFGTVVDFVTVTNHYGKTVRSVNGASALNFYVKTNSESGCVVLAAAYSQEGKLLGVSSKSVSRGESLTELVLSDLSAGGGSYARVMVFQGSDFTKPVYSKKI